MVVYNLRLQSNMLEASSVSYELRILIDRSNEQVNLLFDSNGTDNFSDRILNNIREDFVATTEQVTSLTHRLHELLVSQTNTFGSLFPADIHKKITAEIHNIEHIWAQFQTRINEISTYSVSTLRAGNKLWRPIDASIADNGPLSSSISSLNDLVSQSSIKKNQRLWFLYSALLFILLTLVWGVWLFTLRPLADRLKASYSEILRKNQRLDHQANHDALTGLLNRAAFNTKVAEIESSNEAEVPYCLVLIDLDNFKLINDTLGHNVGDLVLKKVSANLLEDQMLGESAYRLGGDEFALWIDCVEDELALKYRLEALLAQVRIPLISNKTTIQAGCSIGAVIAGKGCGYDHKEMFTAADTTLYQVKANGRNDYQLYDETKLRSVVEMAQSDSLLCQSVDQHEFRVSYQPIIKTRNQEIQGFEARVHWGHPTFGQVHQDNWINDATRLALDTEITQQAIQSIDEHIHGWLEQGLILRPITVDIGKAILLSGVAFRLISQLAKKLPDPSLIGIEVSEMILNERSFESVIEQLNLFKSAGIPITIDHYGRGQSSLLQLQQIPFDVLKIDKRLTLKASYDSSLQTYISSLVSFTKGLGKTLLCQVIQGEAERQKLLELGCLYTQSRHLSTMLDHQDVAKHLQKSRLSRIPRISELT